MTEMRAYPPGTPCWVDLGTGDQAGATAFYEGLFGWVAEVDARPEAGGYAIFRLRGREVAGLMAVQGDQPPAWSTYIASSDVDRSLEAIAAAGGKILVGPLDVLDAGRMAFAADPTGAVFGVWQPLGFAGSALANEPGAFTWNELTTPDVGVAQAFYTSVFGWEPDVQPEAAAESPFDYVVQRLGGATVAGITEMDPAWGDVPAYWMTTFAVADADEAAERVEALGGTVCVEPFDTMYGRTAVAEDPAGATFSLIAPGEPEG